MQSRCELHDVPMERREVPEHPGKTIETCPKCEAESRSRLEDIFRSILISKEIRDA